MKGEACQKAKSRGSTTDLFDQPNTHDRVLLVVNKSWVVTANNAIQNDILSPILNSTHAIKVKRNKLSFIGETLGGELRELCEKAPIHYNLNNQIKGFESCLPNKYKQLGYHTVAVHGALGFMYDREYWYPRAVFQKMMFRDKGLNILNSRCYSFPGSCDSNIAEKIIDKFKVNEKLFLYWLTLNTHAIYDKRGLKIDLFDCSEFNIEINTADWRNLKLQKQFFYTLSQVILDPSLSGTRVIVIGDHEPPFTEEGSTVFVDAQVPVFEFEVG